MIKKQLSFQDIVLSHFGAVMFTATSGEGSAITKSLDVEYLRNTGLLTLKSRDLGVELWTAQEKLLDYSNLVVDLEGKVDLLTVQNDKLKKGLECGICLQIFSVPITLPCSHNYCYECILKCFAPPTGKGSDKTFFQVEKCPLCRASIRLELTPSIVLRDMSNVAMEGDKDRYEKMEKDLIKLKRHLGCIRLGAHCSGRMCLRPRVVAKATSPPAPAPQTNSTESSSSLPASAPSVADQLPLASAAPTSTSNLDNPVVSLDAVNPPSSVQDNSAAPAAEPNVC